MSLMIMSLMILNHEFLGLFDVYTSIDCWYMLWFVVYVDYCFGFEFEYELGVMMKVMILMIKLLFD